MSAKKLPIGIQDFDKLIDGDYLYVDKTQYLYDIISAGSPTFISRPRRFGKSITVSTLEAIFKARRELFKGLWIEQSDWDWQTYPVIRLDMSTVTTPSAKGLDALLKERLLSIAAEYNVKLDANYPPQTLLINLIEQLSKINKVVVLVDEYDKPIIDSLPDTALAIEMRESLKRFYGILKSEDAHLKFVFLTGVTKFAKVSVFSGLNNLKDLTMSKKYSTMMGYTREEIKHYFDERITQFAEAQKLTIKVCYDKFKEWYNGYRFSSAQSLVYNPYSVLSALDEKEFHPYWFTTGTPTFLLDLIKTREFDLSGLDALEQDSASFESFEIQNIPTVPLLYQAGYFTVKEYDATLQAYTLGYPNYEVSNAFTKSLLSYFATEKSNVSKFSVALARNLIATSWDAEQFIDLIKKIMATMPYDLYIKEEKYYHSLFYLILKQAGLRIHAEYHTQNGRPDAVLETNDKILIIEVKFNQTAKIAMKQIKDNKYYEMFLDRKLPIYLVGINFCGDTRTIDDHHIELL